MLVELWLEVLYRYLAMEIHLDHSFGPKPTKVSQVLLKKLINHLGLTICLWVIGQTHLEVGPLKLEQLLPKVTGKHQISVTYNG